MNEEEKKAIDIVENIKFKTYGVYNAKEMRDEIRFYQTEEEREAIDIVLNLIKRWRKEIEELTLDLEEMTKSNNHKEKNWVHKNILNSYISKDKIRKKLNYFEHSFDYDDDGTSYELVIEVLDELLEEN